MPMANMKSTAFAAAAAILALAACVFASGAASAQEVTRDLAQIPAGKYELDQDHTSVVFLISHGGYSSYIGRFNALSGKLKFNTKDPAKSALSIAIDANSVDTPSEKLDEHLRKAEFFNVAKYPEIKFKSTKIEKIDDHSGKVRGNLTLLGVTKPVTLDVTFNGGAPFPMGNMYKLGFSARTMIKRSDFGMKELVPFIGDEVSLVIEAEFMQPK